MGIKYSTGKTFIGTSGYNYNHWADGVFYPNNLKQNKWLEYYCKCFSTVELNVTFYRLPNESTFKSWYNRTGKNFVYAVKGSRFITHIKKLKDSQELLELFFSRAKLLKNKLGVVLWQLPPGLHKDERRLENFCQLLAKGYNFCRHAFEFRHKNWFCEQIYSILRYYNYGLCIAHSGRWPYENELTADFTYIRFHGGEVLYGSEYSKQELSEWANKIKKWLRNKIDVYAYFNNDAYGYAVKNALQLKELCNI